MYLLGEQPAYANQLTARLQQIPSQLFAGLAPCTEVVELERGADINQALSADNLYVIEQGLLHAHVDERPLFYLQEGDVLGLRGDLGLPSCRYSAEEPIRLITYSRSEALAHICADAELRDSLMHYLLGHTALLASAVARLKPSDIRPTTGFEHYTTGDALITQGDRAKDVFIIIEGHAEAFVDGQKVGDVQKDEIFGAMAAFTGERRSASVIASEPCTVMMIPKEQFLSLMESNPRIAHSLIESMARRIDLLNKELTRRCA